MSRGVHALLCTVAVLAGTSPLLWVTAREYRAQAGRFGQVDERTQILRRAEALMAQGAIEEVQALVKDVEERYPDDLAFRQQLAFKLIGVSHRRHR